MARFLNTSAKFLFSLFLLLNLSLLNGQIEHVEPLNWWIDMRDPHLQLMIHGKNISTASVEINYPGITLQSIEKTDNPNFIFVNLVIGSDTRAGIIPIHFTADDGTKFTHSYPLRERQKGSAERVGFNNSDVIYLLMPDRFANGNPENDIVAGMLESKIDQSDKTGRHGGDFKGIIDHLDYIDEMGFTAIWLNPFLENDVARSSYHGYSTTDFYKTDPRYGTNEEFRELVRLSHQRGIKIVMDMIFNHIGIDHWWMKDLPSSDWINSNGEYMQSSHRKTVNQDPYVAEYDKRQMLEGWFVRSMPDLNQLNPFLANYLIQNSIWWIEYSGLSGIRMDTYPYPDKYMMAEWCKRVLNEYPDFNIVGEEWSTNPAQLSYWQKDQVNTDGYEGNLPSLFDFPMQSALTKSLLEEESWSTGWIQLYEVLSNDHLYPDPYNLVVMSDNHDMSRFFMQLGMNRELYKLGIIYILTTRGIPQIFYGSEILMTHTEGDHHGYIRKNFPGGWEGDTKNAFNGEGFSKEEKEMQEFFKTLLQWRKNNPVIHDGRMIHYLPEDGVYVYGRFNDESRVLILLNKTSENKTLKTEHFKEIIGQYTKGKDVISGLSYKLDNKITIPKLTGLVLELN
jgi:glycosidase